MKTLIATLAATAALAQAAPALAYNIPIELQRELERVKNLVAAPAEATPKTYDRAAESMQLYYTTGYRGNFDNFAESGKASDRAE